MIGERGLRQASEPDEPSEGERRGRTRPPAFALVALFSAVDIIPVAVSVIQLFEIQLERNGRLLVAVLTVIASVVTLGFAIKKVVGTYASAWGAAPAGSGCVVGDVGFRAAGHQPCGLA